jgi:DNA-binding CsgD family transcriptional regulator
VSREALSPTEAVIAMHVVNGWSNAQIALHLGRSVKTIHAHRAHINRKLDVHTPAQLVAKLLASALTPPEPAGISLEALLEYFRARAFAPDPSPRPPSGRWWDR